MSDIKEFVLLKRGLYWRPDGKGYTGLLREAGLYSLDDASMTHCAYMINPTTKAVTEYMKHCDAPEFSPACCSEVKMREITDALTEQAATIARLRDALEDIGSRKARYGLQSIQEDYGHDTNKYNYHAMKYWLELKNAHEQTARAALDKETTQ